MARVIRVALAGLLMATASSSLAASELDPWWIRAVHKSSTPVTQGLRVSAPGFIVVDGRWYVYSGPFFGSTLVAFPMGINNGFAVAGWASTQNCRYEPALPAPPTNGPTFLLQEGQTPVISFPIFGQTNNVNFRPEIRVGYCQNTPMISVTSNSGRLVCDGQVEQPFTISECPVISRLNTPTVPPEPPMFRNGFEPR